MQVGCHGSNYRVKLHNYIFLKEFGYTLVPYGFLGDDSRFRKMDRTLGFPKPLYQLTLYKKTRYKVTKAIQNLVSVDP